jgi:F-type H+-transporting ATPase subunit epsilon
VAEMQVDVVGVEKKIWSGEASFVSARTVEGSIVILPGHEPLIAQLREAGVVRVDPTDGESFHVAAFGGFLSVTAESVTVLAELAELASEIDVAQAKDDLREAEHYIGESDDQEWRVARDRARARLQAAGESVEQ